MRLIHAHTGKVHIRRELAWEGKILPKPAICGYQPSHGETDDEEVHEGMMPLGDPNTCQRCTSLYTFGSR